MPKLYLDFETRSRVDLKRVGAWKYAMDPSTEIMCMGVGVNDHPIGVYRPAEFFRPPTIFSENCRIVAHNAHFEYAIYNLILHRRFGWPARWDPAGWDCTMARALMCGLPPRLGDLSIVLGLKTPKDLEGARLMLQLCKPRADGTFDNNPAKLERLYRYNAVDVQAEREADGLLPEMPPAERRVWQLDLTVNRRGIELDIPLARKADGLATDIVTGLNKRLTTLTDGAVDKTSQVAAIGRYLKSVGVESGSLDKVALTELIADPLLSDLTREVLSLRRQAGKRTSTSKYGAALEMACLSDGRIRGLLQYHAAHTGRWGGRGLQPQNIPQGFGVKEQPGAITDILNLDTTEFVGKYNGSAMDTLSNALRGMLVPKFGHRFIAADFSAIEARVLFWLAADQSALSVYRIGGSPYLQMGAAIYGRPITKVGDPKEYDIAKRTVLGCGYGMGWKKFRDNIYVETAKKGAPVLISDELAQKAVTAYREKYASVIGLWREIENAAMEAVRVPGKTLWIAGNRLAWGMPEDRRFLLCRLPSGRYLRYWKPSLQIGKTLWGEEREQLHYWGVNPDTKQWENLKTYGGALTENVVQASARDLLAEAMLRAEAAGYSIVLTVHDEILAERRIGEGSLEDFIQIMCDSNRWAAGCPVAAEGWEGERYRK